MNYDAFRKLVRNRGWTLATLRCDNAPPSDDLLDLMDRLGLDRYEQFVLRLQRDAGSAPGQVSSGG